MFIITDNFISRISIANGATRRGRLCSVLPNWLMQLLLMVMLMVVLAVCNEITGATTVIYAIVVIRVITICRIIIIIIIIYYVIKMTGICATNIATAVVIIIINVIYTKMIQIRARILYFRTLLLL